MTLNDHCTGWAEAFPTPIFLLYGLRVRTLLTRLLQPHTGNQSGNRLDDLSSALQTACHATADSRKYNRQRLANRADVKDIHVGDIILLKAEKRLTLTSCWDPQWEVVRVCGPVLWLRQQQSGNLRVVNHEKVKLVDPHLNWDEITPRPRHTQHRSRAVIGGAPIIRPPQTPPSQTGWHVPDRIRENLHRRRQQWSRFREKHTRHQRQTLIYLCRQVPRSLPPTLGSGPSSVIMDSSPQDNPSLCRLTLTRHEEG